MTIGDRIKEYIPARLFSCNQHTKNKEMSVLVEFVRFLRKREISPDLLVGYVEWLHESGLAQGTVAAKARILKSFLSWCFSMGYTKERWHEHVPKVRQPPLVDPQIVGHAEYLALREACLDRDQEWLIILAYHTGLRMGDCCALRWDYIDQEQQVIRLVPRKNRHKTGISVSIPYTSGSDLHLWIVEMWQLFVEMRQFNDGNMRVCPIMWNNYYSNQHTVAQLYRRIFDRAGLPDKSFKNFRSTFESRMANSGMNIALAAKITGRSDMRTLLRYIKPDMEAAREGISKAMELHHHMPSFK